MGERRVVFLKNLRFLKTLNFLNKNHTKKQIVRKNNHIMSNPATNKEILLFINLQNVLNKLIEDSIIMTN